MPTGITLSIGALCVSVTDSPGPVKHRINAMLICILLIGIVTVLVNYASHSTIFLGLIIFISGFVFSMLTVYGIRSSSVGIAALLIMILNMQNPIHGIAIWTNALYIMAGGMWYLLFSILLYRIRPYKIIQQILGDFIDSIASYLKTRGSFYAKDPDYDKTYQLLLQQQIHVQAQQDLLSELLFKTRAIIKESTHTARALLKLYLDATDLFETIMTTYSEYKVLHNQFDDTGILEEYHQHIIALAYELEAIGLAAKSGLPSVSTRNNIKNIQNTRAHFETLRQNYMTNSTVDDFISIGRILINLEGMAEKIDSLHHYTRYDKKIKKSDPEATNPVNYTQSQDIRLSLFFNNLNLKSNIFRHSLRVALALLLGYLIALYFKIGHSYWILLTIVVILKPAYSLTKKRNTDRLIGTFLGILIGIIILYGIKNNTALLIVMIFFMAAGYVFMRTNYFISVLLMTPYLVIFFSPYLSRQYKNSINRQDTGYYHWLCNSFSG
ncbi:MAG: FUSC family protein [Chitinophagaceae bacterium]|nr:FUSC family protein [Chitinophagaceae bacterium]